MEITSTEMIPIPMEDNATDFNMSIPAPMWPCDHQGPLVMKEKYPFPMMIEAAKTFDNYETMQLVAFVMVFAVSVCGNLVIMIVVYLNAFLRSTINYYLVNLAVSDLLITILCWPTITNRLTQPLYILGRTLCKVNVLTQTTCVTASVMTLSAVACDRVYAVMLPLRARSSNARPLTLILVIWGIAIVLAIPAFLVIDVQVFQWEDLIEESCANIRLRCDPNAAAVFRYYKILLTVMLFFLPAIVMVVGYTVILLRLWCVKRPATPTPTASNAPPNPHVRAKRKVVRMTAMVLLSFLVCWSPLHILIMYDLSSQQPLPSWFSKFEFWAYFLGYCNSALNPLLYGGFSDNFRLGFKNLLKRRRLNSEHMQLPSTAMATSISVHRGSSRLSFQRRSSSVLYAAHSPASSFHQKNGNGIATRCKISSHSRRSSLGISNPLTRRTSSSGRSPLYQQVASGMAVQGQEEITDHGSSSMSLSQHSETSDSLLGTPMLKRTPLTKRQYSIGEGKDFFQDEYLLKEPDVNDDPHQDIPSCSPGILRRLNSNNNENAQVPKKENFTSINEEGILSVDKERLPKDKPELNGKTSVLEDANKLLQRDT